jgi:hypothetical protein
MEGRRRRAKFFDADTSSRSLLDVIFGDDSNFKKLLISERIGLSLTSERKGWDGIANWMISHASSTFL